MRQLLVQQDAGGIGGPVGEGHYPVAVAVELGEVLVDRHRPVVTLAPADRHQGGVDRDAVDPGRQAGGLLERPDLLVDAEEGLLEGVLRVRVVAGEAADEAVDLLLVAPEDFLEGRLASGLELRYEGRVVGSLQRVRHSAPRRGQGCRG